VSISSTSVPREALARQARAAGRARPGQCAHLAPLLAAFSGPSRRRVAANEAQEPVHDAADVDGECVAGGLTVVMNMPLNQATTHFSLCLRCQEQFIRRSGLIAMESQGADVTADDFQRHWSPECGGQDDSSNRPG
jgi:hypothetical protein